jgi:hypothetical protein
MNIEWQITSTDKACVKALVEKQQESVLVRYAYARNLAESKSPITKERLWRAMVCMRLTTLARVSPTGKLAKFQCHVPFPLAYNSIRKQQSRESFILNTIRTYEVRTHRRVISRQLSNNFDLFEGGELSRALDQCNRLVHLGKRETEAAVADYIVENFEGFGPKQSRNVLQALGLTRYEMPIDSRVTDWLNEELEFPFTVTSGALSDRHYYRLILDVICKLCEECGIFPCVLDAAIFGAQDTNEWSMEQLCY